MNRERLQRIRNFQSQDFYPALIVRPITIAVMWLIADWKFLTPNRLTTVATLLKLAAAWLILSPEHWVAAVIVLQLSVLFDHLDGTMARYRRTFTKLGSFYDKVSDMVTWAIIVLAAGWQAYRQSGHAYHIVLGAASIIALNVRGYMKWLAQAESERLRWFEARRDPAAAVAQRTRPIVIAPPPERSARDWLKWFGMRFVAVLVFEEMDLWMWLGLGLLFDRLDLVMWLFGVTQVAGMVVMVVMRAVEMQRLDRRLREVELAGAEARG